MSKAAREQARAKRLALQREMAQAAARRKKLNYAGGAALALLVVAVVATVAVTRGGASAKPVAPGAGATAGLQTTPAPWAPEYSALSTRLQALNLPSQSGAFHIHAQMRVYVNGQQIQVPAQIGIDPQGRFLASLHTHDNTGVIHIEASQTYPFTLGQFFTIWGVKFSPTQLGGYTSGAGNVLSVYVNGKPVATPVSYVMQPHDAIVVGYGKPGSFPTSFQTSFTAGE